MEGELLKIFDEQGTEIGTAPRSEVHKAGHWHETFHCWFIETCSAHKNIYFQIRSLVKKDYPNLLDITAAGHILANETFVDGLREVKEELGIDIGFEELVSLGVIKDSLVSPEFIDNELCHVYVYNKSIPYELFNLQQEEVAGIVRTRLDDFEKLWFGEINEIEVDGFVMKQDDKKEYTCLKVAKDTFVPHEDAYIARVIAAMKKI
jgi:isopentenyldiphosphate isomerase